MKLRSVIVSLLCSLVLCGTGSGASRVFITRATFTGNLGGLAGADSKCMAAAAAAGLPGTYKAWLGSTGTPAGDRMIHSAYTYLTAHNVKIADNWTDLTDGTLDNAISYDELGVGFAASTRVWTGMNADFTYTGSNCNNNGQAADWSIGTANSSTSYGLADSTTSSWQRSSTAFCSNTYRLYCFQQVPDSDPLFIKGRVFVLNEFGRPITHAKITVTADVLPSPLTYYTNRRGEYRTPALPSNGSYTITVSQRRYAFPGLGSSSSLSGVGPGEWTINFYASP